MANLLFTFGMVMVALVGQAANDTEAVNRFYGVVLKDAALKDSLEKHQSSRKTEFTKLAAKYEAFLTGKFDAAADSGDLVVAKECRTELDLISDFIANTKTSSKDAVSDSLTTPNLAGLHAKPPSELIQFRRTWQQDRHRLLANSLAKLKKDLDTFVGQLTKQRKFDDAQAVSDFQQLVARKLADSESVLAAIAIGDNPEDQSNRKGEDGYIVIYPTDIYSYHYGVLVDPSKGFWIDGNQGRGTLFIRFTEDQLGPFRDRISKALLTLHVPTYAAADTSNYVSVLIEGKSVGFKKGARKGEQLQIPLKVGELKGQKEIILQLSCSGSNGMGIVGSSADRLRLLLDFQ